MLKKIKNNNRGAFTTWQRGWMLLILFCVFTFAMDICILGIELTTASHQLSYACQKLSFQGGFIGNANVTSSSWNNLDFYNYFSRSLYRFGVDGKTNTFELWVVDEGGKETRIMTGLTCNSTYVSRAPVYHQGQHAPSYGCEYQLKLVIKQKTNFSSRVFPFLGSVYTYNLSDRFYSLYLNE